MTRWERAIVWARGRPQLAAYLLFIGVNAGAFWTLSNVVLDNEAQRCVDDWELVEAMRRVGPVSNEALIEALPGADPAKVAAVREATARHLAAVIDDPGCDLEAALDRLNR